MKELGEALKVIFEKIAGFFDIFDLSFFVSGALTLGAVLFSLYSAGFAIPPVVEGWKEVLGIVLGSYIGGLLSFAAGRWLRMSVVKRGESRSFHRHFLGALEAHDLASKSPFATYLDRPRLLGSWRLYVRLWAEARKTDRMSSSLIFLNRYWGMAATYDGIGFALILWIVVLGVKSWVQPSMPPLLTVVLLLTLVVLAYACFREAARFVNFQMEELVATIAAQRASGGEWLFCVLLLLPHGGRGKTIDLGIDDRAAESPVHW
jgi:hypothetical protein